MNMDELREMDLKVNVQSVAELNTKVEKIVSDEGGSDLAIQEIVQIKESLDDAAELAKDASTEADNAHRFAGDAYSNANEAASNANEASSNASEAAEEAGNAQSTAENASSKASEAKAGVEDAMARLDKIQNMLDPSKTAAYITKRITNMLVSEDGAPETQEQTAVGTISVENLNDVARYLDEIQASTSNAIAAIQRLMEVVAPNERD